jgi:hypothetical protein
MFFSVYGGIMAVVGAGYYHFAFGVEKTKRELAEAKEKIAAMEKHSATPANDAVKAA